MSHIVTGKLALELRKASQDLTQKKVSLADAVLLVERLKVEAIQAEQKLVRTTHKAAKSVGIDPSDPSKGRWRFDPDTLTFTEIPDA